MNAMITDERPDFFNLIARERGLPSEWRWYKSVAIGTGPREHVAFAVTGGVPSVLFRSGKNKGKPNWAKAKQPTTIAISASDYDARVAQWESDTGKCRDCGGVGQRTAGWSKESGVKLVDCRRCSGTGAKP